MTATGSCRNHNRLFTEKTRSIAFVHEIFTKIFHEPGYIKGVNRRSQRDAIGRFNFFHNRADRFKLRTEFLALANTRQTAVTEWQAHTLQEYVLKTRRAKRIHALFDKLQCLITMAFFISIRTDNSQYV